MEQSVKFKLNLEQQELSTQYFQKCTQLSIIEEPFDLQAIPFQLASRDIQSEFELLRALTETKKHKLKLRVNSIFENKKNRYPEQSIYEHSRVILEAQYCLDQNNQQGYINANFVKFCPKQIIITQAPVEATVRDFESMIIQQNIDCVIMLCNIIEGNKTRCYDYLAEQKRQIIQSIDNAIEISQITISFKSIQKKYQHIFYSQWPDRGVPQNMEHLRQIIDRAEAHSNILVHCSAGLGRSGVISSILSLNQKIKLKNKISIFGEVRKLRQQRFGSVQNNQQYKFIYQYFEHISKKITNK